MLARLQTLLEFPLLRRELTELAQRRSTYTLRCLCLTIFAVVFFTVYLTAEARLYGSYQRLGMLGQGRHMVHAVYIAMLFAVYALAPALSCGAITSEKEKQTLNLLLITRMTPLGIVLEKVASRMLPLLSLVTVSLPLFCVGWLHGGVAFSEVIWGVVFLFFIAFQITCVAVFCSALLATSSAAFWMTYLTLLVMYFGLPVLSITFGEMKTHLGSLEDGLFLLFPPYQLVMLAFGDPSGSEVLLLTVPSLLVTVCFLPAARFALTHSESVATLFRLNFQNGLQRPRGRSRHSTNAISENALTDDSRTDVASSGSEDIRPPRWQHELNTTRMIERMADRPVRWREQHSIVLLRWRVLLLAIIVLLVLEMFAMYSVRPLDRDDISAMFTFGMLVTSALAVLTLTSKLFAKERERQTLDVLLTMPVENRQLLRDKTAAINRVILVLLCMIAICGLLNLCVNQLPMTAGFAEEYSGRSGNLRRPIADTFSSWLAAAGIYMLCLLGTAAINLNLVKWIAMYFGLKMKTQMRAMTNGLVSVLLLCLLPLALLTIGMIQTNLNPNTFPLWFFSSPAVFPVANEIHDLHEIFRGSGRSQGNGLPRSELLVVLINFAIWGSITLCLRAVVIGRVSDLLQRLDRTLVKTPLEPAEVPAVSTT